MILMIGPQNQKMVIRSDKSPRQVLENQKTRGADMLRPLILSQERTKILQALVFKDWKVP